MSRVLSLSLAVCCLSAPSLFAWGREGHAILTAIAEKHLNSRARAQVAVLLGEGQPLASIASWADEVRPKRPETSTWHYINVPIDQSGGDWTKHCPAAGCLPRAIEQMAATLQSASASREQRTEALKFFVHFMGDLHQPLHVGERGDRGGNDVAVMLNGKPWNLHSAWDTGILTIAISNDPALRERLARGPGWWSRGRMRRGSLSGWVGQSAAVSRQHVYPEIGADRPYVVTEAYHRAAMDVIAKQLQRGGMRLAAELNRLLGD